VASVPVKSVVCNAALVEFTRANKNVRRFYNLIWAVAAAAAATLIWALLSLIFGRSIDAMVAGVVAVLGGGGVAVLVNFKNSAMAEYAKAQAKVRQDCRGESGPARGEELTGEAAPVDTNEVLDALTDLWA